MKAFAELYERLDATHSTLAKVEAIAAYLSSAPPADAAWAVYFLSGKRLKRTIPPSRLRIWGSAASGLPEWLFETCYHTVGDLAETVALLVEGGDPDGADLRLAGFIEDELLPLAGAEEEVQEQAVHAWWRRFDSRRIFLINKMLTGALRVGVARGLTTRAVAAVSGLDNAVVAQRLMGPWKPSADFYRQLVSAEEPAEELGRPYPFFLASPLGDAVEELGAIDDWQAEWKWDGIRAQLLRRGGETFIWSRGEDLLTDRFPELTDLSESLPNGTVLDGEILAWRDGRPLPFAALQTRIGRRKLSAKVLAEAPVELLAYDLLEADGVDLRQRPLAERRSRLEDLATASDGLLQLSPRVESPDWVALEALRGESRSRGVEGFILKRLDSPYRSGRRRGDWWKWKVDPLTADAVMIYAQAGHGRRASLFTDYTFAVWDGDALVPFAKAYSGLDNAEIRELDRWIRRHTRERFGPVRSVEPHQVFEVAFEGIQPSKRHKSGLAVRFPRILRWRRDKRPEDADRIETVRALVGDQGHP
ncbi:MAG: ATP-dependent DNA ligase [Acidobacteriota bacterium]